MYFKVWLSCISRLLPQHFFIFIMSSSVFIESSSIQKAPGESLEGHGMGTEFSEAGNSADSNLVVVYGKNGINFDRKGLENLIGLSLNF